MNKARCKTCGVTHKHQWLILGKRFRICMDAECGDCTTNPPWQHNLKYTNSWGLE